MKIRLLACPECGGTLFEVYHATFEEFFDKHPLTVLIHRCKGCGWESHPKDEKQLRQLLIDMLHGGTMRKSFVYANEHLKT
jgi:rubredoxin